MRRGPRGCARTAVEHGVMGTHAAALKAVTVFAGGVRRGTKKHTPAAWTTDTTVPRIWKPKPQIRLLAGLVPAEAVRETAPGLSPWRVDAVSALCPHTVVPLCLWPNFPFL